MIIDLAGVAPELARHIVQRMGETGQPPERGARLVNVGTDELLAVLRREYLEPMRELGRNSSFKLVQAPFGGGKTHFLHCLRELAGELGFLTAMVGVSPDECPFDDPEKIYRAVARCIELPPSTPAEEPQPGIEVVFRQTLLDKVAVAGEATVRAWLRDELEQARVESRALRRATRLFLEAVLDRRDDVEELLGAYLRGEPVSAQELAALQIREAPEADNAFRFLRSLAQVLHALQLPGLVLLFDELDRVMSLSVRRRRAIGDNLRQMIDHCGQSTLPAVLWAYAVPPEFLTNIVPEYPALEQRLKSAARFSVSSPLQPVIDLDHLPLRPAALLEQIGLRLLELYEIGFEPGFDHAVQAHNMRLAAHELGASQLESGTRRSFVRAAVHLLTQQQREGQRRLTQAEARSLAGRGTLGSPPPMPGEEDMS